MILAESPDDARARRRHAAAERSRFGRANRETIAILLAELDAEAAAAAAAGRRVTR